MRKQTAASVCVSAGSIIVTFELTPASEGAGVSVAEALTTLRNSMTGGSLYLTGLTGQALQVDVTSFNFTVLTTPAPTIQGQSHF